MILGFLLHFAVQLVHLLLASWLLVLVLVLRHHRRRVKHKVLVRVSETDAGDAWQFAGAGCFQLRRALCFSSGSSSSRLGVVWVGDCWPLRGSVFLLWAVEVYTCRNKQALYRRAIYAMTFQGTTFITLANPAPIIVYVYT